MLTVYVSIGNTDDRLSQGRWAMYHMDVAKMMQDYGGQITAEWFSHGTAMWQTACWRVEVPGPVIEQLKGILAGVARAYDEAVGWAPSPEPVFLC